MIPLGDVGPYTDPIVILHRHLPRDQSNHTIEKWFDLIPLGDAGLYTDISQGSKQTIENWYGLIPFGEGDPFRDQGVDGQCFSGAA